MSESESGTRVKFMPMSEFRLTGLLQEINRRLLHPMGLAMSVRVDDDDDGVVEGFGEVYDYRDDPEGAYFGGIPDAETVAKKENVDRMFEAKREVRERVLGYHVQPIDDAVKGVRR